MKPVTIITDSTALNKAIDAWGKTLSKAMMDGQMLALSALAHLEKCGDIGAVNRLVKAMPKGTKTSSMAAYLLNFGALRAPQKDDADYDADRPFVFDKTKKTDVEGAREQHWTEFGSEKPVNQVFDLQAAFKALLKKANGAATIEHGGADVAAAMTNLAAALGMESSSVPAKIAGPVDEPEVEVTE